MRKTLFAVALALLLPAWMPAAAQSHRFLLRMESNGRLAAYAVVDAYAKDEPGKPAFWQMTVTYYLQGRRQSEDMLSRHYGSYIGQAAGDGTVRVSFDGPLQLSVPTPGGDHVVELQGGQGPDGRWSLSGNARFKGEGRDSRWSVISVHRIQAKNVDLRD